jgi:hypothetical protein
MKKVSIVFLFTVLSLFTYSQYSYYKSVLITKSDLSKISGYVEKVSESSLNSGLKFKTSPDEENFQILPVEELNQVIFLEDSTIFDKVKYSHFIDANGLKKINEFRLAKKMLDGYADLYKLQLPSDEWHIILEQENTFVYIVVIDTNYYLLEQKESMEETTYRLHKKYKGVLSYILRDHEDLKSKLKKLKLNDNQIVPLINELNLKHSEITNKKLITKEKIKITHGPTVGYTVLNNFEGYDESYVYQKLEGSGYEIGYTASFTSPAVSEKISSDIGVYFEQLKFSDSYNNNYSSSILKFPVNVTYNFNNKRVSPFLGIGFVPFLYVSEITSTIILNDIFLKLSLGLAIHKKYIVSFTVENTDLKFDSPRFLFVSVGYRFGTGKLNVQN